MPESSGGFDVKAGVAGVWPAQTRQAPWFSSHRCVKPLRGALARTLPLIDIQAITWYKLAWPHDGDATAPFQVRRIHVWSGRPQRAKSFVPNPAQRNMVTKMTGWGIPQQHICRLVANPQTAKPLDPKSLRKHFALEIGTYCFIPDTAGSAPAFRRARMRSAERRRH
jgi:hypothetical protein